MKSLLNVRLHFAVLLIVIIADTIGIHSFPVGPGKVVLLPLLYSFLMGLLLNPYVIKASKILVAKKTVKSAGFFITLALMPFIAKFSFGIGPKLPELAAASPALLLQELGNLGTMVIAMPVAVLLLKMGRESIGATHSIAREPNVALVSDKYGLTSPEGVGVMGVYVVGTLFGTIFFSLMAGYIGSMNVLDIRSLAMACGVGSGSMTAACTGALVATQPDMKETIEAFAASSNALTYATGLYMSLFIALPLSEKLYSAMKKRRRSKK